jgi:uncharacterized protein YyaL (SSP411 family)
MRILYVWLLVFATLPLQAEDNEINWLGNYRDALAQARQENKPIFLEFRCEA